jgi:hypothetical protein
MMTKWKGDFRCAKPSADLALLLIYPLFGGWFKRFLKRLQVNRISWDLLLHSFPETRPTGGLAASFLECTEVQELEHGEDTLLDR